MITKRLLAAAAAPWLIAAAPVLAPGTEADRAPDWLVKPDGDRIAHYYPERAMRDGVEGGATIVCVVRTDTQLHDCAVQSETPAAYGFGDAAVKLAGEMRMAPAIRQGLPVEAQVRVPLAFRMPETELISGPPLPGPGVLLTIAGGLFALAGLLLWGLVATVRALGRR